MATPDVESNAMYAAIQAIEFHLPERVIDNQALVGSTRNWTPESIREKTGIAERRVAADDQFTSDLAVLAAEKLFGSAGIRREELEFVILCTQTPDYLLPSTACLVHERLGLRKQCGALDVNLGCSGFVYCLSLAKGLLETGQVKNVLLLTADTYSKLLEPDDFGVRSLFGDAAAATLISSTANSPSIGPFVHGTDGSGAEYLMTRGGALRRGGPDAAAAHPILKMDGPSIFHFTLDSVPGLVQAVLDKSGTLLADVDLFIFHQANQYMLEHLRKKLEIPAERFMLGMHDCGNTVSSSIPIAWCKAQEQKRLQPGMLVMLVGFGVGLSWSACLVRT